MLTISRTRQRLWPILASVGFTLAVWLLSKWYYGDTFADPFKYPAKAASLTATVLMCWAVVLSARWRFVEDFFGGMDKVYQVHKRLGRWAFWIILAHPLCLAADQWPDPVAFLQDMWFRIPRGDHYLLGQNFGVAALLLMTALIVLTLWLKPAYHVWKRTHEWFGLVMVLAVMHVFFVDADVAAYPVLRVWLYGLLAAALVAFVYIRFLYRFLGPRYEYVISTLEKNEDILELYLSPTGRIMDFKPSQFVYLVVNKKGVSSEPHPYSIASGYNLAGTFKLGIRQLGDHTSALDSLQKGDKVTVYGPYGRFSDAFLTAERDCVFIGGGIGITPFMGMWHVALHSEDRLDPETVPARLQRMHPEIIKTWKSPRVSLFYICRYGSQASFDSDIRREVTLSHFHGFTGLEERGHQYFLHLTSEHGRPTARSIHETVPDGVLGRYIFICGPNAMTDALISQFLELGVPEDQIIMEDFNLF